jgi:hypothetical protein
MVQIRGTTGCKVNNPGYHEIAPNLYRVIHEHNLHGITLTILLICYLFISDKHEILIGHIEV